MKSPFLFAAVIFCATFTKGFAQPPNIIVILTDDQGLADYSAYGTPDIKTPNLDRIFRGGATLPNFHANSCVCSPSRAALLTGCYPDRVGVPGVIRTETMNSWGYLSPKAILLPQVLKTAGYTTALVGKWHLGLEDENSPNSRGFDFFHGFLGDEMDSYWTHLREGHNYMRLNRDVINPVGHATDLFTAWALSYLKDRAKTPDTPFFLYLAYTAPHFPIQPTPEWLAQVKKEEPGSSEQRQKYVALVEQMDAGVGQVLDLLDQLKLSDNTLIIFNSDNGGVLKLGANDGPWRGEKQHMYEGGLRVPGAARWPGKIQPGTIVPRTVLTMDIFATACDAAGVKPPAGIDGVSFLPDLLGHPQTDPRPNFYFVRREGEGGYYGDVIEALIQGDWKIVKDQPYLPFELYDLQHDPKESIDLRATDKDKFNVLIRSLERHVLIGGQTPWQKEGANP